MKSLTVNNSFRLGNSINIDMLTATKDELKKQQKIENFFEILLLMVKEIESKSKDSE